MILTMYPMPNQTLLTIRNLEYPDKDKQKQGDFMRPRTKWICPALTTEETDTDKMSCKTVSSCCYTTDVAVSIQQPGTNQQYS